MKQFGDEFGPSPGADRKIRLECLKLALGCINPDLGATPPSVIADAMTFYRYVVDEETPQTAEIVKMKSV